jgi:hypothetical protein
VSFYYIKLVHLSRPSTRDSRDYHDDFTVTKDVVFVRPKKEAIPLHLEPKIIRRREIIICLRNYVPLFLINVDVLHRVRNSVRQPQSSILFPNGGQGFNPNQLP